MLACLAFNLTRAARALASRSHAKATTIRDELIHIPARVARSARAQTLHLPEDWPWQNAATALFDTLHTPPIAAACPNHPPTQGPTGEHRGKPGRPAG